MLRAGVEVVSEVVYLEVFAWAFVMFELGEVLGWATPGIGSGRHRLTVRPKHTQEDPNTRHPPKTKNYSRSIAKPARGRLVGSITEACTMSTWPPDSPLDFAPCAVPALLTDAAVLLATPPCHRPQWPATPCTRTSSLSCSLSSSLSTMADNTLHTHKHNETQWSGIRTRTALSTVDATRLPLSMPHDWPLVVASALAGPLMS